MTSPPDRLDAVALGEGLYLAYAAATLSTLGLFEDLGQPATAADLAKRRGVDAEMLGGLLEYLTRRTSLVKRTEDGYATGEGYDDTARFVLALYGAAFALVAASLPDILRRPSIAGGLVDRAAQARAFERAGTGRPPIVAALIVQLGLNHVLDLGCGSGAALAALAGANPDFRGWGVDMNPAMCRAARARLREAGASRRVRILRGDARDVANSVPAAVLERTRTVLAADLANELFRGGGGALVAWLKRLRRMLPGRILVISDYYGRLHADAPEADPVTLLHDFCQLISGQGVPPPDRTGWERLYAEAGCDLRTSIDDEKSTRFIHLLHL